MQPRIQSKANLTDFGSGFYLPSPARNKAESLSMFYFLLHIAVLGCLFHVCCRFLKSSLFVSLELRVFFLFSVLLSPLESHKEAASSLPSYPQVPAVKAPTSFHAGL